MDPKDKREVSAGSVSVKWTSLSKTGAASTARQPGWDTKTSRSSQKQAPEDLAGSQTRSSTMEQNQDT